MKEIGISESNYKGKKFYASEGLRVGERRDNLSRIIVWGARHLCCEILKKLTQRFG